MLRIMIGNINTMQEILDNVFKPVLGEELEGVEVLDNDPNKLIKYDLESLTFNQARIIEALLYNRKADGLLENIYANEEVTQNFEVLDGSSELLLGSFEITVENEARAKEIIDDVFKSAGVYNVHVSMKPVAPGMFTFCKISLLAVGLTEDQIKLLNRTTSMKSVGLKTKKLVQSATTTGYSSAKIVANDIVTPLAECAGKYAGLTTSTAVKATYKAGATFADEVFSNITREEFTEYEPAKRAVAGFKRLIHGDKKQTSIMSRSL